MSYFLEPNIRDLSPVDGQILKDVKAIKTQERYVGHILRLG